MMSSEAEAGGGGWGATAAGAAGDPEGTLRRNPVRLRLFGKAGLGRRKIGDGVGLGYWGREETRGRGA
uniref:Flowering locus D n=1 Tax=Arundo donax TaxID=35708 RepID=A0A0A9DIJ9_ARUDO